MARKVLKHNGGIVAQDTGYNCGPATAQNIAWAATGKIIDEGVFAREMQTTTAGTNTINHVANSLNRHLPNAEYVTVQLPNDPPTAVQRDALWRHIVNSIDAGFGVAMNWVAPPSNYPRGILGSQSPNYSGGVVYHYVMAAGYDDAAKAILVVDSGFWPRTYWVSLDQCASLIPPKGYSYASVEPNLAPVVPESSGLSDAEWVEVAANIRYVAGQFGPNVWSAESSLGVNDKKQELTLRDAFARVVRKGV